MTMKESTIMSTAHIATWRMRRVYVLISVMCAFLLSFAATQQAGAAFGISSFANSAQRIDGSEESQAGAHPYSVTVSFGLNTVPHPIFGQQVADENVRDMTVDLPAGFLGDTTAAPTCTSVQLTPTDVQCPVASQVGVIVIQFALGTSPPRSEAYPVFNLEPGKGDTARFGFNPQGGVPVNIVARIRSKPDYGVQTTLNDIPEALPIVGARFTLWGVPQDPSHDAQRGQTFVCLDDPAVDPGSCSNGGVSAGVPRVPFLTNPTLCDQPLTSTISADSWVAPSVTRSLSYTSASAMTGCDRLHFDPTISVKPDSTKADGSTGLTVDVAVPQNVNPDGLATATLRNAVVTLPAGFSLNPSAADGLQGCTEAQVGLGSTDPVTCPDASKVGDIEITTPVLKEKLTGAIYLAQPVPGRMFHIYLVAGNDERGISIRLEGVLGLDSQTGLVTTTFANTPQLPFSLLHLHFKGGPRAPLATPQTCGVKNVTAQLTPWAEANAAPVTVTSSFTITRDGNGAACPPPPFDPGFAAGLTRAVGGADGAFTMTLTRNDYDQELGSVGVTLPKGALARIASVTRLCSDAAATAGTCGEDSRVGSVTTGAGAGSQPFFLPGRVYLTGPYKDGPYGLSIVVPAIAGPFDLGTVVVRAAIQIDPTTTQITVASDPLPTIIQGVPLRLRVINVTVDRPHFTFAPTNCTATQVRGRIVSTQGAVANVSSRFQVANCARLPFHPRMSFAVGGKGHTGLGSSTPLTSIVKMPKGQANLAGVSVTLPLALNARLDIVNKACTQAQFDEGHCAAKAGTAVAVTPLLKDPLRGSVYFVKTSKKGALPNLVVALRGPVDVNLTGKVKIPGGTRLETNFDHVPDVPISSFTLHLVSGQNGPLGVAENLCTAKSRRQVVSVGFRAQNGRVIDTTRHLRIAGCPTKKGKKAGR